VLHTTSNDLSEVGREEATVMAMRRASWVSLILAVGMAFSRSPLRADELKSKLTRKLQEVHFVEFFREQGVETVAVGDFSVSARLNASGGLVVGNTWIDVLEELKLKVDRNARMEISGRISRGEVKGLNSLKVQVKVEDTRTGRSLLEFDVDVVDAATIMRVAGGTGDISGRDRKEQSDKVGKNLENPSVEVGTRPGAGAAGTRIAPGRESPYAIELLVKREAGDYRPAAATVLDGQAFITLRKGQVYAVRLINDSDRDAAVVLAIDGLSMFAFADSAGERDARIIVPRRAQTAITGWFRNDGPNGSNEFLVAPQAEAAVARQLPPSPAKVGMVTAEFSVAWPVGSPTPPGESEDITHDDGLATALGKPIDQPFQKVEYLFGKPKAAVTVRYNRSVEPADLPR
jgi:hypothetical protein